MKSILQIIILFIISISSFAQVDITIEPCIRAKDEYTKKELKNYVKGYKGNRKLPKGFFTEKVMVFILINREANISHVIKRKPKEGNYSFVNTIEKAKRKCKEAGLNVASYIIDEKASKESLYGLKNSIPTSKAEEDFNMVKKSGAKYYIIISDRRYSRFLNAANIISIDNSIDIYNVYLKDLIKQGKRSGSIYNEGNTINRFAPEVTYGGSYGLPDELKVSKVYFIYKPNLILPSSKPQGLGCKMQYNALVGEKKEYLRLNKIVEEEFNKCEVDYSIVDKESEIVFDKDSYILKEYKVTLNSGVHSDGTPYTSATEGFYLENTVTKKVYAFEYKLKTYTYEARLQDAIRTLNEH